jgi:hypothetical protein
MGSFGDFDSCSAPPSVAHRKASRRSAFHDGLVVICKVGINRLPCNFEHGNGGTAERCRPQQPICASHLNRVEFGVLRENRGSQSTALVRKVSD